VPDNLAPVRLAVFALFALAVVAALGSWLVRARHISPFSGLGRGLRTATDWIVKPVERRLLRMGGNPVHAGAWLVIVVAVAGVILLSLLGWLQGFVANVRWAAAGGSRQLAATLVTIAYSILFFALIVRVVGMWLGLFRYNRWMRPFYALTDWLVEPIRRVVPSFGPFDISPLLALIVLWALKAILLMALGF
jgi:YggT family protein